MSAIRALFADFRHHSGRLAKVSRGACPATLWAALMAWAGRVTCGVGQQQPGAGNETARPCSWRMEVCLFSACMSRRRAFRARVTRVRIGRMHEEGVRDERHTTARCALTHEPSIAREWVVIVQIATWQCGVVLAPLYPKIGETVDSGHRHGVVADDGACNPVAQGRRQDVDNAGCAIDAQGASRVARAVGVETGLVAQDHHGRAEDAHRASARGVVGGKVRPADGE